MKLRSRFVARMNRGMGASLGGAILLTAVAGLLIAPTANSAGSGPYRPSDAVKFEEIEGTKLKRVILTERAAERLGIKVGEISEEVVIRTQMLGGKVVMPVEYQTEALVAEAGTFSGFATAVPSPPALVSKAEPDPEKDWIMTTLSKGEWERMRQDAPVRIFPLATRDGKAIEARPAGMPPYSDPKRTMLRAYYVVDGKDHGLQLHERVRIEAKLTDSDEKRMVAPYAAVHYDGAGKAWAYVETAPFTYERKPLDIERIEGDWAVLRDGPPIGTRVVTTGASLLYGAEVIYKR